MDRQAIIGFVLIAAVLIVWMTLNAPTPSPPQPAGVDTAVARHEQEVRTLPPPETHHAAARDTLGRFFSQAFAGDERVYVVETDLYTAEITTRGGLVRKWELKKYAAWDGRPVQLVEFDRGGDFSLLFASSDGKLINTRSLRFDGAWENWYRFVLEDDDSVAIKLVLTASNGGRIAKTLTFRNGTYTVGVAIRMERMEEVISGFGYDVVWEHGLRYAEHNSVDESSFAMGYAYSGGELAEVDATGPEPVKSTLSGLTDWVATRTKYFAVAVIPAGKESEGAYIEGVARKMLDEGVKEDYSIGIRMPFRGSADSRASVTLFLGPLDFDVITGLDVGLDQIMSLGAAWIIRPISEWVMIPLFQFLRSFIPNYGVVIIIFSIIIKIALHPLTRTSMRSMKKMQALQPMMEEIRAKHKDEPDKMNRQIMQLYKDYGVNPAGGCLPMLLQLPILYALWMVFRSAIELRQAHFVWWITDLSAPDVFVSLPFHIPLFGVKDVSGLALLMGITMFIQQKMTIKDPRQKMMVWMMPILMTLLFNSFPSGLNLYYFVFNLLSIGQQLWVNKQHDGDVLRKVEGKKRSGGFMSRLTKDLPKLRR